jgi:IS30 family transposase
MGLAWRESVFPPQRRDAGRAISPSAFINRATRLRRSDHNTTTGHWRSQIKRAVSIRERPPEVEERTVPGLWEGDLPLDRHDTQFATLV